MPPTAGPGFAKQGGRTGDWRPSEAASHLAELVGSQVGLATPLVACLCAAGVWSATRQFRRHSAAALLAAMVLPGVAVFVQHAIGDRVQANWPAILFPAACLAAAAYTTRFWRLAVGVGFAITAVVYLQASTALLPLPRSLDPTVTQLGGWDEMARQIGQTPAAFVAADNYGPASILAHDLTKPVIGLGKRWSLFALPVAPTAGQTGLLLRSRRRAGLPDPAPWSDIVPIEVLTRSRNGVVAEQYDLYRVTARGDMVRLPGR